MCNFHSISLLKLQHDGLDQVFSILSRLTPSWHNIPSFFLSYLRTGQYLAVPLSAQISIISNISNYQLLPKYQFTPMVL